MVEGGATWGLGGFNFIDTKLDSTTYLLTTTDTENNTSSQYIQTTTEMGGLVTSRWYTLDFVLYIVQFRF